MTDIDNAYARYQMLSRILERARERALSNPTDDGNINLGFIERGQKRQEAQRRIEEIFEELGGLVNHLAILDMTATFETFFQARLSTAIGEARKVVRERYRASIPFHANREILVHDADHFQGLGGAGYLIGRRLSHEVSAAWDNLKENRNKFAHGTDIRIPPTITVEAARDLLNELLEAL